jgi:hypothetical protein
MTCILPAPHSGLGRMGLKPEHNDVAHGDHRQSALDDTANG